MEHILAKQQMDAAKALADTSVKISDMKNILFKLQEEETLYLIEREQKALAKINHAVEQSNDLIEQIRSNHSEVHQFCGKINEYVQFLQEAHGKYQELLETFKARNELWEENVKRQDQEFSEIKRIIKEDQINLDNQKKDIQEKFKKLDEQKALIKSRQDVLDASYKVEKKLWDKLNQKIS